MNKDIEKNRLTKGAQKAFDLAQEFTEDIKTATEAMKRTARYKNTRVVIPDQHVYEQIFSKNS